MQSERIWQSKVARGKALKRSRPAASPAPVKRKNLKRQTTAELVADELRSRIIAGEIGEGEQLLQEQLASDLGVSRIPLREAMRQLEAEGLITLTSHRGGVVSVLTMDQIRELFEIRACLESWLLTLAIPVMTNADFESLDAIIDEMHPGEIAHWGELNWRFHQALYAPARRDQTLQMLRRVAPQSRPVSAGADLRHLGMAEGERRASEHRRFLPQQGCSARRRPARLAHHGRIDGIDRRPDEAAGEGEVAAVPLQIRRDSRGRRLHGVSAPI